MTVNEQIQKMKSEGNSVKYLAWKFKLSERQVRNILGSKVVTKESILEQIDYNRKLDVHNEYGDILDIFEDMLMLIGED